MKKNPHIDKTFVRKSNWLGTLLLIVAAITLEATSLTQYFFSRQRFKKEASERAEDQLENIRYQIMDILDQAESAVRNNVWLARWGLTHVDSLDRVTQHIVEANPVVVGSAVAFVPGYNDKHPLLAPYSVISSDRQEFTSLSLATEEYDYPSKDWFTKALNNDSGHWSEPYFDTGGGEMIMTTFSMPVRDWTGKTAAVVTADISLDWLTQVLGGVDIYPNAFSLMFSRQGQIMVCPVESLVMHTSVHEMKNYFSDTSAINKYTDSMMAGESGSVAIRGKKSLNHVYFAPVERTGWSMSIVIPDKQIYGSIKKINHLVNLLQLLGLFMLFLILRVTERLQRKYSETAEKKDKMENELQIAKGIQMSMIPKTFPPFPERDDIDMLASIVPAKEVSGDLYDFFINDERLYFCIGDVSGKGVPASLVMAVTRSLFHTVSPHEKSPARILSIINDSMTEMNESDMFVTFFCGILDLNTGVLRFCNAGHNPPMIISDTVHRLDVLPNLPLGVIKGMEFREQRITLRFDDSIFLYTDGVTEAENAELKLFGEERLEKVFLRQRSAQGQLEAVKRAVEQFVGGAPQNDDQTMLLVHYTKDPETGRRLVIHNDVKHISKLADFVEFIAKEDKLDTGTAHSINLALEEAVTNVVLYAYPKGYDGLVYIEANRVNDSLNFVVSDFGKEFDPLSMPDADTTLSAADRPIGGLGIHLVRTIMDDVRYKRSEGRNILTMTKKL